jgi:hypothetical protein
MLEWCAPGLSCDDTHGCHSHRTCTEDGDCNLGVLCEVDPCPCEVDRCLEGGTICSVDGPDVDGDTYSDRACDLGGRGGSDCDDANPNVHPDRPEICGNLIDDDCSEYIDYEDLASTCTTNLGNDLCVNAVPLVLDGLGDNAVPVELSPELGADGPPSACPYEGPDVWYRIGITDVSDVTLDTIDAAFDTVVSLVDACDGSELLCNDNRNDDPANGSRIVYRALPAGTYWVRVGSNTGGVTGRFVMHYDVAPTFATSCDSQLDASQGGTYHGSVSDGSIDINGCTFLPVGYKERFRVDIPVAANLTIITERTTFPHRLYVRDTCDQLSLPTELLCATGPEGTGTSETLPDFIGNVSVTLEFETYGFSETAPDGPYVLQINP